MACLRFVKYGKEPGVQDMELSQAGSSQQKTAAACHQCYCARAWDQTPQRARKKQTPMG